ncbi:MAG: DUF1206 domain-containing protein [Woeseia sp.]
MDKGYSGNLGLLARAGYAARGVVYVIVGSMAALAALGPGGETPDSEGALVQVLGAPFGKFLLVTIAAGLLCYACWRAVQALLDADSHGTDAKGLAIRSGLLVSAITHLGLTFVALGLVFGLGSGGSGSSSQEWTARLMSESYGSWLVAAVGLVVMATGIAHGIKAWRADFARRFSMSGDERSLMLPISRFGLFARGAVFLIIGGFFAVAAIQQDPNEARGLSGALQALHSQPYGWILLGIVSLGLLAFGLYSIIESIYRRIGMP